MEYHHYPSKGAGKAEIDWLRVKNEESAQTKQSDYKAILGTPAGRRVLWDILSQLGMWHEKDTTSRSVGLRLLHYLSYTFTDDFLTMQQEHYVGEKAFEVLVKEERKKMERKNAHPRGAGSRKEGAGS